MPLKTYRGPSSGPLLAQVQAELGPEAVIVRTAQVGGEIELIAGDAESARVVAALLAHGGRDAAPVAPPAAGATPAVAVPRAAAPSPRGPAVIALVGPTGAGKTTTLAKLASHPRAFAGRRVGLLCLDTYRVGALDQLAVYAELAGLPVEAVYHPSELDRARRRLAGCDVILVDCPGRGPRGQRDADAVRDMLRHLAPEETHLVLPAGIQPEIARRLAEHHRARGATHLLASKVDEVPDDWTVFELAAALALPMRWLADGQRVPQDIRSAAPRLEAVRASARRDQPRQRKDGAA